jgi:hypothetical protein
MARRRGPALDPIVQQALVEAQLQLGPQFSALDALDAQRRSEYINTRRVNASNARGVREAALRSSEAVGRTFGAPDAPEPGTILAALMRGAGTAEGQAAYNRFAGESGQTQAGFQQAAFQAEQGRQYGNLKARNDLMGQRAEIQSSRIDLARQAGLLTQSIANKAKEAQRQRAADMTVRREENENSRGNALISAGYTPDGRVIPGGPADINDPRDYPNGSSGRRQPKLATTEKHEKVATTIEEIAGAARRLKRTSPDLSRSEIVDKLSKAVPTLRGWTVRGKDGKPRIVPAGTPGAQYVATPGRKAYAANVYMTAALDLALDGHLSQNTVNALQGRRFSIRQLGLSDKTAKQWRKKNPPLTPAQKRAVDAIGRILG